LAWRHLPAGGLLSREFAEFLHFASAAVSEKASTRLVPAAEVAKTNPMAVTAVRADVNRALFGALVIAAVEILHDLRQKATFR
jgi:hypothetical protein